MTGGVIWLVWVFVCGIALGALVCVALWLSRSTLVERIIALADAGPAIEQLLQDLTDAIARSERAGQDISDEQEGSAGS